MHGSPRTRLSFQPLEDRTCPAVAASLAAGVLSVSGAVAAPGDALTVQQTAAGTFQVEDGATVVAGGPFAGVTAVRLKLTGADDLVNIDLGGLAFAGGVSVNLAGGTNALTVRNGSIAQSLYVQAGHRGAGTDSVALAGVTVGKDVSVDLDGGPSESLTATGATVTGNLTVSGASAVTLDAATHVGKSATVWESSSSNVVDVEGSVGRDLSVLAGCFSGNTAGTSSLTLGAAASVGRDLVFTAAWRNTFGDTLTLDAGSKVGRDVFFAGTNKNDVVTLGGEIDRNLTVLEGNGSDRATLAATAVVKGSAAFAFGNGNDTLDIEGHVGTAGNAGTALFVGMGRGTDDVTVGATAAVTGKARVVFGPGADTFTLSDAAPVTAAWTVDGGGHGTYHGMHPRALVTVRGFTTFS